ncbi:hypothetical protein KPL76_01575 [Subtercola sp. PAMC28395]|uniref:hypothetical protein n=1 Tax=Subtercola sp. PAMC28395 TaxID=2846775 RepID=UPI001C0D32DC|nr:hypothetical protein [Subtercola sp. PAMC28395]QWT24151.1 hypothetical protein KPL76_01575 [Subtercola sp. PAMC28395]
MRTTTPWETKTSWGTARPTKTECLIEACAVEADCVVTVESEGLRLRYAACSEHGYDISWGLVEVAPSPLNRGLIGLG